MGCVDHHVGHLFKHWLFVVHSAALLE
jgi:hypothetical protein